MDEQNDNMTTNEQETEQIAGVDGEERSRADDIAERMERMERMLRDIIGTLAAMRTSAEAIDIDNGASVRDVDGDGDADIIDDDVVVIPDYDELDLDL